MQDCSLVHSSSALRHYSADCSPPTSWHAARHSAGLTRLPPASREYLAGAAAITATARQQQQQQGGQLEAADTGSCIMQAYTKQRLRDEHACNASAASSQRSGAPSAVGISFLLQLAAPEAFIYTREHLPSCLLLAVGATLGPAVEPLCCCKQSH